METSLRIAGLSISHPCSHLVVLHWNGIQWAVESAVMLTKDLTEWPNPWCLVVLDAASFFTIYANPGNGQTDAQALAAAGWRVQPPERAPAPLNPREESLIRNFDELVAEGRLVADTAGFDTSQWRALRLAAWGVRQQQQQLLQKFEADTRQARLQHLLPHQHDLVESLDEWIETNQPIAVVLGDRRSGRRTAVEAWVRTLSIKVETVTASLSPEDEATYAKVRQDQRELTVIFDAERIDARFVVDALHAGRVVLVNNPVHNRMISSWLFPLVAELKANAALGTVIECRPSPQVTVSPEVAKLASIIDPEAR